MTLPNRILYSTNIAKGERKDKRKSHFRLGSTESHPTLYKYNERCVQDKTNPFAFYAGLHLLFAFYANIVKGECRDKRELYFRFDYAEPNPIFVFTNIVKGESRDKRKSHFQFGYAEPHPIFVFTKITKLAQIRMDLGRIM